MSTINPRIAREWADNLRSGDFKQGRKRLRDGDRFCCLGVLCDMAVKAGVVQEYAPNQWHPYYRYGDTRDTGTLPEEVWKWAGLAESCPQFGSTVLTMANDEGMSFGRIADIIDLAGGVVRDAPVPES